MDFNHIDTAIGAATQVNEKGSRYYKTPEGKNYTSITTILSKTSDMSGLERWRRDIGPAVADFILKEAGKNGTTVHGMCEDYLNNKTVSFRQNLISQAHFRNLIPFLDRINNIRGLEIALYSDEYQMAGTADCIANYDGKLSVIDFKTSRSQLLQRYDKVQKYFMQATAYSLMWKERTKSEENPNGIDIEQIVILGSEETGGFSEFVKDPKIYEFDLMRKLEEFRKL